MFACVYELPFQGSDLEVFSVVSQEFLQVCLANATYWVDVSAGAVVLCEIPCQTDGNYSSDFTQRHTYKYVRTPTDIHSLSYEFFRGFQFDISIFYHYHCIIIVINITMIVI